MRITQRLLAALTLQSAFSDWRERKAVEHNPEPQYDEPKREIPTPHKANYTGHSKGFGIQSKTLRSLSGLNWRWKHGKLYADILASKIRARSKGLQTKPL